MNFIKKDTEKMDKINNNCRHILSLSGGKDSTALALYLKDRVPNIEYVFCDTGEELKETYEYLLKLEACLGVNIKRLNPERRFRHYLDLYRGVLPDPRTRWCTRMLKIKPFEKYVGTDNVVLYVGIRADEPHRKGNISTKENIFPKYPFIEDGIRYADVMRILETTLVGGKPLGLPKYYEWRSRSGCYFCFFQQRREWVGLLERHPDLFWKAAEFEKVDAATGNRFTWIEGESLRELAQPARIAAIKKEYKNRMAHQKNRVIAEGSLKMVFDEETVGNSCLCHL